MVALNNIKNTAKLSNYLRIAWINISIINIKKSNNVETTKLHKDIKIIKLKYARVNVNSIYVYYFHESESRARWSRASDDAKSINKWITTECTRLVVTYYIHNQWFKNTKQCSASKRCTLQSEQERVWSKWDG